MFTLADRLDRGELELTHDFSEQMLGERRASVTKALGSLERRKLIQAGRRRIMIRDRAVIEDVTCECYGIIRKAANPRSALPEIDRVQSRGLSGARATVHASDRSYWAPWQPPQDTPPFSTRARSIERFAAWPTRSLS
jgi:hypothetical protein